MSKWSESSLRDLLQKRLNLSELRNAAYDLNIDYEGIDKDELARRLIIDLDRREQMYMLVEWINKHGPDIVTIPLNSGDAGLLQVRSTGNNSGTTSGLCPICGKKNLPIDTFRCRSCRREDICDTHLVQDRFVCIECTTISEQTINDAEFYLSETIIQGLENEQLSVDEAADAASMILDELDRVNTYPDMIHALYLISERHTFLKSVYKMYTKKSKADDLSTDVVV